MSLNFTAIDFETATAARHSTCEIGLTHVENGSIVETESQLIKPRPNTFHFYNTKIHGITAKAVSQKPEFDYVWESLRDNIKSNFLIAHNAAFDMGVLRSVLNQFSLPVPEISYACSVQIARKAWPERSTFSLDQMANFLGLKFAHHRAGDDARICAEVVIAAATDLQTDCLIDLLSKLDLQEKKLTDKPEQKKIKPSRILKPELYPEANTHPFYRKEFVFTGKLRSMSRRIAMEKIQQLGAYSTKTVTDRTAFIVVGDPSPQQTTRKSAKLKYALELIAAGQHIEILSEPEFIDKLLKQQRQDLTSF